MLEEAGQEVLGVMNLASVSIQEEKLLVKHC